MRRSTTARGNRRLDGRTGRWTAALAGVLLAVALSSLAGPTGREAGGREGRLAEVPAPESVLGFVPGEDRKLADWDQVLDYVHRLAAASDRVRVDEVGQTTQGRPFVLVTVTSAANQARLEALRQINLRLADPRGLGEDEAASLVRAGRAIVAMAFSIHSTEVGGTLASLRLLHHLAASDSEDVRRILDETILLVLPSHNPDGTDLVTDWYRRELGTSFEGTAPPVLYHRYAGHDNNRDWYAFALQETRLTVAHLHHRWHPQIMHDVHQMGSKGARLFVPPYTDPWEPHVDPALIAAAGALGTHVAWRLTAEGRPGIVIGAIFDAWTPARAYTHTHAGVRLLSESASARLASPIEVRSDELEKGRGSYDPRVRSWNHPDPWPGGTWRLGDIVDQQLAVSMAILDHAARHREEWLRSFLGIGRRACAQQTPHAFVVPVSQPDPLSTTRLLEILRTGGVEVHRARSAIEADGVTYPAGSHVVLMQQPASAFAATVLGRQHYPGPRPGEASSHPPYDVTAHTLPLLLGVRVDAVRGPFSAELETVDTPRVPPGVVEGEGPWLALPHGGPELVALGSLLEEGAEVRWALDSFSDGGRDFAAGTLLVRAKARPAVETLSMRLGLSARAVSHAPRALRLRRPRVGLYRSWVPAIDEGWTRYVFETETGVAYRNVHDREVRSGRLRDRFDAIVLPDQDEKDLFAGHPRGSMPEEYTGGLGEEGVEALRSFVESGGTLLAFDSASTFAMKHLRLPVRDALAHVASTEFSGPGSILEVRVDTRHPLAHGLPASLPVWFESSPAFEIEGGTAVMTYGGADPLLSGWLLGGERLEGRAALVDVPLGKGHVVLFGFRPQYRAQSRVTYPVLLNALYLSAAER
jgi:Zinc carboxypeptidase